MRTIIAGSRQMTDEVLMADTLAGLAWPITEVISGGAGGADRLGEAWAARNGIPVKRFPADWARYGKGAGPVRNREMALYAEALVAFWDGRSPGTKNMIDLARQRHLRVHVEYLT
jgi:hypothetical protein